MTARGPRLPIRHPHVERSFPYRLAAIDLDDTLLGPDHRISARNARAVRALVERGVTCVIASGRMVEATTPFADALGLDGPVICYNGAMVKARRTGEVWRHLRVSAAAAAEVIRYCARHGHHLNYYLDDHLYVAQRGAWADFYLRQTGSPMEVAGDLEPFVGTEPTKMILIDAPETTARLLHRFEDRFGDGLYITRTNLEYLEFMNPAASKGAALGLVAERLGVPQEATIACGDGDNDVSMLRWAGLGIAMGGARPAALEAADLVAPRCEDDGLAAAVEGLLDGEA